MARMDETPRPQGAGQPEPPPPPPGAPGETPPGPPEPPSAGPPHRHPGPNPLAIGWTTAVVRSLITVAVLGVIAEVIAMLAYLGAEDPDGPVLAVRLGGLLFYAFNRVGVVFDVGELQVPADAQIVPAGFAFGATLVMAAMTGTMVAGWLLYRAGRAIGRDAGGSAWIRGLHGVKVALPYAAICFAGSFLIGFTFSVPETGRFDIHPSYLAALLWPLTIGATVGFVGGFLSTPEGPWPAGDWGRRLRGAVAGGWWMTVLGLALAFVGLLLLMPVNPDTTRAYFEGAFSQGAVTGVAVILAHSTLIPNMAAWVLFPSMGACVGLSGGLLSACVLSYTNFPAAPDVGGLQPSASPLDFLPEFPTPEPAWFLFVLVPLVATLAGGMIAVRKANAGSRGEAAAVGALAGVVYGVLGLVAALLSTITLKVSGGIAVFTQTGTFRIGPFLLQGFLFAVLWGAVGGALGGLIQGRSARRISPAVTAWEPTGPQPEGSS